MFETMERETAAARRDAEERARARRRDAARLDGRGDEYSREESGERMLPGGGVHRYYVSERVTTYGTRRPPASAARGAVNGGGDAGRRRRDGGVRDDDATVSSRVRSHVVQGRGQDERGDALAVVMGGVAEISRRVSPSDARRRRARRSRRRIRIRSRRRGRTECTARHR